MRKTKLGDYRNNGDLNFLRAKAMAASLLFGVRECAKNKQNTLLNPKTSKINLI